METAVVIIGLVFICYEFTDGAVEGLLEGVQSECRDHYLWIQVSSGQTPHFEAVDGNGVHTISEQLASRCGYTISTFKMDGFTTFRASYYSCFTHNQNDKVFTFRFNVIVSDDGGRWTNQSVSAVCSGLTWTHREITCEENYMEVNVDRASSCGGQHGQGRQVWKETFSQENLAWQLMFLQSTGQVSFMSVAEAQKLGYSLTTTPQRAVLRSPYKEPQAEVMTVDSIPVQVVRVSLFFKQKLVVLMLDMSMVCTVNSGSFDGAQLLWDIPRVLTPLAGEAARFESRSFRLGVESVLLDNQTATSRGFSLVQQGGLVQIRVPFGAEGGYRKSLVVKNEYKEAYVIFLLYEHIFSLIYEDGSSIDTKHRILRVLETPLVCRPPFTLKQTIIDQQMFSVYLGNIPADVTLEEVWINGKLMSETSDQGFSISPIVHLNGSHAYKLQLPFEDDVVHWKYVGGGVVQYSIEINFTLTIMPQRDSYYHYTAITAQVLNSFPPEITAQCLDGGISFSVVRPTRYQSIWEVGIDHEPLTSQMVAQRGYRLYNESHRTTLEVPVFSIGYTYEEINLSNFYATFELLVRDSKTLEIQTSISKRCLFKTEDMIVCSADGTMTVVATPASTWPMVQPDRISLLDRTCRPKQADGARVLFEFKLDSCGTRAMVGELYMVYENEMLYDRLLIPDGPTFISRESQFKVTVRCFYPLSAVNRLSVDRVFRSETLGLGSIKVFESHEESANKPCPHHGSESTNQVHPTLLTEEVQLHHSIRPRPKPGPSHFITVPGAHNKVIPSSNLLSQAQEVPQQVSSHGPIISPTDGSFSSSLPKYYMLPDERIQWVHLNTPSLDSGRETSGPNVEYTALALDSFRKIPGAAGVQQSASLSQIPTPQSLNSLGDSIWSPGQKSDQLGMDQTRTIKQNKELQSLRVDLPLSVPNLSQQQARKLALSLYGSSGKKHVPVVNKHSTHKNTTLNFSGEPETSTTTSRANQNLYRTGSIGRRNVQYGVKKIKVKPPSKFVSSGLNLNQKPVIQQANLQSYELSQYARAPTATSKGEIRLMDLSLNHRKPIPAGLSQQGPEQKLVQLVTGNSNGQESVLQTAEAPHVKVRLSTGLPVRLQTHHQSRQQFSQNPVSVTRGGASRMMYHRFMPQTIREYRLTDSSSQRIWNLNPAAGRAGSAGPHTGTNGSGGSDSEQNRLGCGGMSRQYGASVHRGILRGTQTPHTSGKQIS